MPGRLRRGFDGGPGGEDDPKRADPDLVAVRQEGRLQPVSLDADPVGGAEVVDLPAGRAVSDRRVAPGDLPVVEDETPRGGDEERS